ncbi:TIGR02281 family clan AA aspartic protease [Dasania sp. GY-MA-18]|uniref:TIGR02281 family clan AA aspartic protease n=1 Tax=Dasania phycosphaerae TaxID=2950436 RepID=A0A9J6RPK2_9GAMM|nr:MULTISPECIES: TIGR02281 family clan AA aspartic protease [Dasania]MCR8923670.1 TIGR02281 family clan AA aspartic protease [Dasania sp. GY-MA-18]MCZ0866104.1 TIGR02281 family clan AA aspartic protease [Dasania phycosphaerae]MCZ0869828.1 TIGR02281 family clan AA aspartic protease [Dasania phycosphaerae]
MNQPPQQRKLGTGMYIMAWVMMIALLGTGFQQWYEDEFNPNQQPQSQQTQGLREVVLHPNRQHHYIVSGTINQQAVVFLLDTGATHVAVPSRLAQRLQLKRGLAQQVNTANGTATAYSTEIKHLSFGNISLHNVKASINPGMNGEVVLLGMSALKQLEFTQKGELLILRQ